MAGKRVNKKKPQRKLILLHILQFYIGDGLGRNRDGMSTPLKAAYKFDKTGLGHNKADEFNNHWWENMYNNAAGNLDVNKNEDGAVSMALKGEPIDVTKNF